MMPSIPVGQIAMKAGHMSATDEEVIIKFHGVAAHSFEPEAGANAISVIVDTVEMSGMTRCIEKASKLIFEKNERICKIPPLPLGVLQRLIY